MSHNHHHNHHSQPAAAIGGKTARACDGCIRRRARWFCAADDAFLCDPCDSLIHSANQLANRHHRLRLKSSSATALSAAAPSWHHGFTRKPRTPRSHHKPVVPDLESSVEDEEEAEQLLYRVPVFDPPPPQAETEMEDFSADMESLLGRGFDRGEAFSMEELGLGGGGEDGGGGSGRAVEGQGKTEEEKGEGLSFEMEVDLCRETLELDFGCGSSEIKEEIKEVISKGMGLSLDYEAVKEAWMMTGTSPWMAGERPRMGVDDYWHECLGQWGGIGGELVAGVGIQVMDVGREARVTRYREKRRTRLFSKKIRYEVRKLNAEKRPRMKGRFVKRASFQATTAAAAGGVAGGVFSS